MIMAVRHVSLHHKAAVCRLEIDTLLGLGMPQAALMLSFRGGVASGLIGGRV